MDIETLLGLAPRAIRIVDIGAAFFGETPPYQPLLERGLGFLTAFEPHAPSRATLEAHLGPGAQVLPHAVGDGATHTLRICHAPGMNSLLEPDAKALAFFNMFETFGAVTDRRPIDTVTLDSCEDVGAIDFLKMDVQGSELMILRDGRARLAGCLFVQTEVSFTTLYENQPPFGAVDLELRSQGFVPHCFTEVKRWSIKPTIRDDNARVPFNQVLEGDIVFMRDLIHHDLDPAALGKIAAIAHYCYRSYDLAARCLILLQDAGHLPPTACQTYYQSLAAPAPAG